MNPIASNQDINTYMLIPNFNADYTVHQIYPLDAVWWIILLIVSAALIKTCSYLMKNIFWSEDSDRFLRSIILLLIIATALVVILLIRMTINFLMV